MDVGCRPRGCRRSSVKRVDGTAPLILSWLRGPPCHLKGREPGSLLECGKLKTMLPDLACLISRGPGHTAQPRPPSQPSLSSVLTACRHLVPIMTSPWSSCTSRASGEDLGPRVLDRRAECPQRSLNREGGVPSQRSREGPHRKVASSLLRRGHVAEEREAERGGNGR